METLNHEAKQMLDNMIRWRRYIHKCPELAFKEVNTSKYIVDTLKSFGYSDEQVQAGFGITGVRARVIGAFPGNNILLRFDIDALPLQEDTQAEYSSVYDNVHHACGHDGHVAIGLATAAITLKYKDKLHGSVTIIFQPAEEILEGARAMIKDGVLEGLDYHQCFALHLWNLKPVGWISLTKGAFCASAARFTITLRGSGGHAACPHQTSDIVLASANLVNALQTIVSRNVDPAETAVVTVSTLCAGTGSYNIIPDSGCLKGTIRTFSTDTQQLIFTRIHAISKSIADLHQCEVDVEITPNSPPAVNDVQVANEIVDCLSLVEGLILPPEDNIRVTGADDMAEFLARIPGCYLFIGSANPTKGLNSAHHSPKFDFDEEAMVFGAAIMITIAFSQTKPVKQ
jgi:amidohydrolase